MHLKLEKHIKNKFREIYPFKPFLSHVTNMLHLFVYRPVPVGRTWDEYYNLICIYPRAGPGYRIGQTYPLRDVQAV